MVFDGAVSVNCSLSWKIGDLQRVGHDSMTKAEAKGGEFIVYAGVGGGIIGSEPTQVSWSWEGKIGHPVRPQNCRQELVVDNVLQLGNNQESRLLIQILVVKGGVYLEEFLCNSVVFIEKERVERGHSRMDCGPRVSCHQDVLVSSLQPHLSPSGQCRPEIVGLQSPVSERPQLGGGVTIRPVHCTSVYEGAVNIHLLPRVVLSTDWFGSGECEAISLGVEESVLRNINIEAELQFLVMLLVLQEDELVTTLVI